MPDEDPNRSVMPGKETVVRRHGSDWSFTLPEQHSIRIDHQKGWVRLGTPSGGSTFLLNGLDETDGEAIVSLGDEVAGAGPVSVGPIVSDARGYPLPEIQDELERLRARWVRAGYPEHEFNAYSQGSTHEDQLRRIRARLRVAEEA